MGRRVKQKKLKETVIMISIMLVLLAVCIGIGAGAFLAGEILTVTIVAFVAGVLVNMIWESWGR